MDFFYYWRLIRSFSFFRTVPEVILQKKRIDETSLEDERLALLTISRKRNLGGVLDIN